MRTFLVYVKLELKRALRFLPWIAAGAMVLAGLLGSIALFAFRTVESGAKLDKLKVGVVVPEEDGLAKKAVSMLGTLDSVESICQFLKRCRILLHPLFLRMALLQRRQFFCIRQIFC